ncbi:MAG: SigB/SigF/SigG family RNA polymerase sigma factor [Clostridiales bacterium]|nr:SigB/SigF/SigG family RNA polymerase sigma factor [Clostridiales bacterium]
MLSGEETLLNLRKAKSGDTKAKEILLENNVLLLKSIIRRFKGKGVEYDDLYQLASMGLLKAINNFDEKFGVVFSTYAVPMIIGEIKRFLRDDGAIKVSRLIKAQAVQINRYIEEYGAQSGETPTVEEIAVALNMEKEDVVLALDSNKMPLSLSEPVDDKDGEKSAELADKIPSNEREEDMVDKILLRSLIEKLPDRERKIIIMRYYRDNTQSEIAKELGVSQVQVSRIENKIINTLKKQL